MFFRNVKLRDNKVNTIKVIGDRKEHHFRGLSVILILNSNLLLLIVWFEFLLVL